MIPRTKYQEEVWALYQTLPTNPDTIEQIRDSWNGGELEAYGVLQMYGGWVVYRMFYLFNRRGWSTQPVEVHQQWFRGSQYVYIARKRPPMPRYSDTFIYDSEMEIRDISRQYEYQYRSHPTDTVPYCIFKEAADYPYPFNFLDQDWATFIIGDFKNDPFCETAYKRNPNAYWCYKKNRYKSQEELKVALKICWRNNYEISDYGLYGDYIDMLVSLKKDIHNAFYACPKDLKQAHDVTAQYIQRKKEKEEREMRRKQMVEAIKKADAMKAQYVAEHQCYSDVVITDGMIKIKVLPTIEHFFQEGMKQHHCVCANEYFNPKRHPNTLILSARLGDWDNPERFVETIDVDTQKWEVRDSRGLQNQRSEYHDKIMAMMKSNMGRLRHASQGVQLKAAI